MNCSFFFERERIASYAKPVVACALSTGKVALTLETRDGQVNVYFDNVAEARTVLSAMGKALDRVDAGPTERVGVDL